MLYATHLDFESIQAKKFPSLYLYNNPEKLPFLCYELLKIYVEIALVNCDVNDHLTKALADGFKSSPCLMRNLTLIKYLTLELWFWLIP